MFQLIHFTITTYFVLQVEENHSIGLISMIEAKDVGLKLFPLEGVYHEPKLSILSVNYK